MKGIVLEVKSILPEVKMIHYMTDSPTSQYRNKQIFSIVDQHDQLFPGVRASWLYFEAGHGKGACDGVGGTAKRLADMAVKRQTAVIQSAENFYDWGKSQENSSLRYIFVSKSQCKEAHEELSKIPCKPVKGTLQLHAVVPVNKGKISVRATSCYCEHCFKDGELTISCKGWVTHDLYNANTAEAITDMHEPENAEATTDMHEPENNESEEVNSTIKKYSINTFVAALYDGKWYLGKITDHDEEDKEYFISFMVSGKKSYKWPD